MNVSFGSKVRPRTFGCVVMRSAVLFDSDLPDERYSSGRFHHVQAGVVGTLCSYRVLQ